MIYIIPIYLHIKCYHGNENKVALTYSNTESKLLDNSKIINGNSISISGKDYSCVEHQDK